MAAAPRGAVLSEDGLWLNRPYSRYRGVSHDPKEGWQAQIAANADGGEDECLGSFPTEAEADAAYVAGCAARGREPDRLSTTSGFVGVDWREDKSKWRAHAQVGGTVVHLNYFDVANELGAAGAYAVARAAVVGLQEAGVPDEEIMEILKDARGALLDKLPTRCKAHGVALVQDGRCCWSGPGSGRSGPGGARSPDGLWRHERTSGFVGVGWHKAAGKWQATVTVDAIR